MSSHSSGGRIQSGWDGVETGVSAEQCAFWKVLGTPFSASPPSHACSWPLPWPAESAGWRLVSSLTLCLPLTRTL